MSQEEKTTGAANHAEAPQRVITIVASRGEKVKINFLGNSWSELKELLTKGGQDINGNNFSRYDLGNTKCVESINKTTLEHAQAVLPDGDLNLFLMPVKSKSGSMSRTEINAAIKKHIEKDGDKAKQHFSHEGKNYTQVSSDLLAQKLESYAPGTSKNVSKAKAQAIADVVESVAAVVKDDNRGENLRDSLQGLSDSEKLDVIIGLLAELRDGLSGKGVTEVAAKSKTPEEIAAEEEEIRKAEEDRKAQEEAKKEAEEKKRKQKEEDEKLDAEFAAMSSGFNDVRR